MCERVGLLDDGAKSLTRRVCTGEGVYVLSRRIGAAQLRMTPVGRLGQVADAATLLPLHMAEPAGRQPLRRTHTHTLPPPPPTHLPTYPTIPCSYYLNNFEDGHKQDAIDLLAGAYSVVPGGRVGGCGVGG